MNPMYIVLAFLPAMALAMNCTGKVDGNHEIACRSYTVCSGGKATVVTCDMDMAYNQDTGKCDDINNVPPPCGVMKDCSNLQDAHYPDTDYNCKSYYTCVGGIFVGHNFCPSTLVFNEELQSCDWPKMTKPPCGTKS